MKLSLPTCKDWQGILWPYFCYPAGLCSLQTLSVQSVFQSSQEIRQMLGWMFLSNRNEKVNQEPNKTLEQLNQTMILYRTDITFWVTFWFDLHTCNKLATFWVICIKCKFSHYIKVLWSIMAFNDSAGIYHMEHQDLIIKQELIQTEWQCHTYGYCTFLLLCFGLLYSTTHQLYTD